MNILKYTLYRIIALFLQIIGAVAVITAITSVISYDPSIFYKVTSNSEGDLGTTTATQAEVDAFKAEIGLDKPAIERFFDYITAMFTKGDLGNSWYDKREPVTTLYLERFTTTLVVFGLGILLFTIIAVVLGILSARRLNSSLDQNVRFTTSFFYSFPPYVLGTLFIFFTRSFLIDGIEKNMRSILGENYSFVLNRAPVSKLSGDFFDFLLHAITNQLLPIVIVVLIYTGFQFRLVRIYVSEVLNKNYIRTAHAKGLDERTILLKHGLRNAFPELITSIATTFPVAISGVVVLEKVFNIEGSGLLLIEAGLKFNWPVLIGGSVIFTTLNAIILNLSDLIVHYVDPQLRLR